MMFAILFALASSCPQAESAELKPGEAFRLATEAEVHPATLDHPWFPQTGASYGRIVDAFTRQPIEGAIVETWTEELNSQAAGFEMVSRMATGPDGSFLLTRGAKGRASAAGYATSTDISIHESSVVELFPMLETANPARIRFLDTNGNPIPEVRVTSTLTCSHDVPALDVRSDADGVAVLPNYGFQYWVPELRFRAAGFRGTEYFDGMEVLANCRVAGEQVVVLPRRLQSIRLQLLDHLGEPYAGEAMHFVDGECYHIVRSDERGLVEIDHRYDGYGISPIPFGSRHEQGRLPNTSITPPERVALRMGGDEWEERHQDLPRGRFRVEIPDEWLNQGGIDQFEALLTHEDGWFRRCSTQDLVDGVYFPIGSGMIYVGGENSMFTLSHAPFQLLEHQTTVLPLDSFTHPRRSVQLVWPEDVWVDWIEHAGETISRHGGLKKLFVTPGEPAHFCWHTGDSILQRAVSATELAKSSVIDLTDLKHATRVNSSQTQPPASREVAIRFPEIPFNTWSSTLLRVDIDGEAQLVEVDPESDGPLLYQLAAPAGSECLVQIEVDGHRPFWLRTLMPEAGAPALPPIEASPIPSASLQLVSNQSLAFVGGKPPSWLDELDPGPLGLTFRLGNGNHYRLETIIEAGEQRVIDLDRLQRELESESESE